MHAYSRLCTGYLYSCHWVEWFTQTRALESVARRLSNFKSGSLLLFD